MPTWQAGGGELSHQIMRDAEHAGLRVGERLPTERRLADDLGVSRTVVRHALSRLEAEGAISREVGRGTYIRQFPPAEPASSEPAGGIDVTDVGPADVMAVRLLLEPQAMPMVVAKATARDIEEVDQCLAGGDTAGSYADFEVWDLAFHQCLINAAHNPLLLRLYACVEAARHGQMWGDLKRRNDSTERRTRYQAQHRAIAAALRVRNSDAAAAAMRVHLTAVCMNLLGGND